VFFASIPGKAFTGFLMEIIGRPWRIAYALAGSLPGHFMMLMAHRTGDYATVVMVAGALITGFTVLSAFTAVRVYLSEQFPTALRGRGHIFGESFSRLFAGVLAPFLMEPHTRSPTIFFGTIWLWWQSAHSSRCCLAGRRSANWRPSPNGFERLLEY